MHVQDLMKKTTPYIMKNNQPFMHARDTLIHIGVANVVTSGYYRGHYSFDQVKQYGNFGIGAPANLDGEMVMLDGRVYQTLYTGATFEASGKTSAALAFVHFFEKDMECSFDQPQKMEIFYTALGGLINRHLPTAIRVHGRFDYVRTRAFPPVTSHPAPSLQELSDQQRYFINHDVRGVLVGYHIPAFLQGINISGFHFHFLSDDRKRGGHVIDFGLRHGQVEMDVVHKLGVLLPPVAEYCD